MTQAEKDNEKNASTGVDIEEADDNDNDNDHSGTIEAESNEKDDCSDLTDNNEDTEEQAPKSFPLKLLEILSNEEHSDVITWLPHGNGFIINKKKTFANEILPKFFKATKFTSFTRKLNRWGFSRAPRGPETGAYFHKMFRRDKPELCLQMTSNSGNKYQTSPLQQHMIQNAVPAMMPPGMTPMPMFPYMPTPMAFSPQQQQVLWQQQMQMFYGQQMQMMQMQQQQQLGQQQQRSPHAMSANMGMPPMQAHMGMIPMGTMPPSAMSMPFFHSPIPMASMPPNTISGDGGDATKSTEPQSPQQPLFQQQISGAETQQPNNVTGVPNLDGDTPVKVEGI